MFDGLLKRKFSRRGAASLIGASPLLGRQVGRYVRQGLADQPQQGPMGPPPMGSNPAMTEAASTLKVAEPVMPMHHAYRLALRDPTMARIMYDNAWNNHRVVHFIDPDIDVHRSFSNMAKITFQRQRNVERMINEWTKEPDQFWDKVHRFIGDLMYPKNRGGL